MLAAVAEGRLGVGLLLKTVIRRDAARIRLRHRLQLCLAREELRAVAVAADEAVLNDQRRDVRKLTVADDAVIIGELAVGIGRAVVRALLDKAAARVETELAELREDVRADTVDDVRALGVIVAVARKDQRAVRRLRSGTVQVQAHEQVRALLLCKVHASLHLAQWRRIIRAVTIGARHVHMDMAVRLELLLEIEADPEHAVRLLIAVGAVDRTGVISARAVAAVTGVDRDVQPVGILGYSLIHRSRPRHQQCRRQSHGQKKRQDSLHHLSDAPRARPSSFSENVTPKILQVSQVEAILPHLSCFCNGLLFQSAFWKNTKIDSFTSFVLCCMLRSL